MKKYSIILFAFALGMFILNSCSKGFLDVTPKGTALEANYYKNAEEAYNGLVAAYDPLGRETGATYSNKIGPLNSASDDCYAGGGSSSDVPAWQAWNNFTVDPSVGIQSDFWGRNFQGVYRVNVLLEKLPGVKMSETLKARFKAEALFLRAYYYFDLVRLFKNVPLFTTVVSPDNLFGVTQAKPEEVYAQIEKDLNDAIPSLPESIPVEENGRVTKFAAKALLGKVILFQNNESRMQEAAVLFDSVNSAPYYELLPNFGDIFSVDNKFNRESIFEISHTSKQMAGWDKWDSFDGNVYTQMCGARGYSGPTYMSGWGFNPIILDFVNIIKQDPRYPYTVANIDSLKQKGLANYDESGYQNTGYFVQRYAPLKVNYPTLGGDPMINYPNNYIEIRLADTYLMEAEALVRAGGNLSKAQSRLDKVRARVGLPSIPATLENIYKERRLELATEGHRFFDLVRTGQAATALAFKGFTPGKNEILPIPLSEIAKNSQLNQNPGY